MDWNVTMTPERPQMSSRANVRAVEAPPPGNDDLTYIWGTGIAVETFQQQIQRFFETFQPALPPAHGAKAASTAPFYIMELHRMRLRDSPRLDVDMSHLAAAEPLLAQQVQLHPNECLQLMGAVTESLYRSVFAADFDAHTADISFHVGVKNLPSTVALRELSPSHIETLVALQGMVVRTSRIIPEVRVAHFACWMCQHVERSAVRRGRIFEPTRCASCGAQCSYRMIHNLSLYEDKQLIRLQEAPEHLADGETPVTMSLVVYGDLVDSVVPGDRVVATGIYRSSPMRLNSNTRIVRSIFATHMDGIHIEKASRSRSKMKDDNNNGKEGRTDGHELETRSVAKIDAFRRLTQRPDWYDILLRSFAPAIWGHDDVKKGILCQMFGGSQKTHRHGNFRAEMHVILCGDPGVAKSQLLTIVHSVSPRGVYTSGKGSSSVGLTAFVVKDGDTGEFVLEPGALVLSDRGVCCIDEFDKMNEATRSVLHEVMEQQSMSIAKAGIVAQLNARTSILAAANPKESQWNPSLNIVENLQIEPTLLSRFDLIFLLLDRHDEATDRRLASHVLELYVEGGAGTAALGAASPDIAPLVEVDGEVLLRGPRHQPTLPPNVLAQFIHFAKSVANPILTEASEAQLSAAYVELRRVRGSGKTVSATLRQLESMLRLSEARAKMRLSDTVSIEDVEEAKRLMRAALKEAATDPRTGLLNMDMFSAPDPNRNSIEGTMARLERLISRKFLASGKTSATVHDLRASLNETASSGTVRAVGPQQFIEVLSLMAGGDFVSSFTATTVQFTTAAASGAGAGGHVA